MVRVFGSLLVWTAFFFSHAAYGLPVGYDRGTLELGRSVSGVYAVDDHGLIYYGHSTLKRTAGSENSRGSSNELWTFDPNSGSHRLFYAASAHPGGNQMKSVSGMVIDTDTIPWTYYLADQDPADDPWTHGAIWKATDINGDGDIDDSGETMLATADTSIISIEGVIRDPVSGVVFASNSGGSADSPMIYRLADNNGNGFFDPEEITVYFRNPGDAFTGKLTFNGSDFSVIFTVDSGGRVYRLEDLNGDADCLDTEEGIVYVTLPISGGFDIKTDPDGELFVTASEYGVGHKLVEIGQGNPPLVTEFDDLTGSIGWSGTIAFDGGGTFRPGLSDAVLYVNYSTITFGDPSDLKAYQGRVDVPAMGWMGLLFLLASLSIGMSKRWRT